MAEIFPLLTTEDVLDEDFFVARKICNSNKHKVPVVGFARLTDEGPKFINWDQVEKKGHTIEHVEKRAIKTLKDRSERPGWEPVTVQVGDMQATVLSCQGSDFTASDMLDPTMMRNAQNYFNCTELFVGAPTRTMLIASDKKENITDLVFHSYKDAGDHDIEPLSLSIFKFVNGKIKGVVSKAKPDVKKPVPTLYHVEGKNALWLSMSNQSYEDLYQAIQLEMTELGPKLAGWHDFQGQVVFDILDYAVRLSKGEKQEVRKLIEKMTEDAKSNNWTSPYGDPIEVSVQFPKVAGGKKSTTNQKTKTKHTKKTVNKSIKAGKGIDKTATQSAMHRPKLQRKRKPFILILFLCLIGVGIFGALIFAMIHFAGKLDPSEHIPGNLDAIVVMDVGNLKNDSKLNKNLDRFFGRFDGEFQSKAGLTASNVKEVYFGLKYSSSFESQSDLVNQRTDKQFFDFCMIVTKNSVDVLSVKNLFKKNFGFHLEDAESAGEKVFKLTKKDAIGEQPRFLFAKKTVIIITYGKSLMDTALGKTNTMGNNPDYAKLMDKDDKTVSIFLKSLPTIPASNEVSGDLGIIRKTGLKSIAIHYFQNKLEIVNAKFESADLAKSAKGWFEKAFPKSELTENKSSLSGELVTRGLEQKVIARLGKLHTKMLSEKTIIKDDDSDLDEDEDKDEDKDIKPPPPVDDDKDDEDEDQDNTSDENDSSLDGL